MGINIKPTVISTFAGCGGSSLGYKLAGYKELLAIEWESNAVETFKLNFPEVPIWQRDICSVTGKEILDFCKIKKGELDVFDGSPPCQGFSTAGKRELNDSRNDLFKEYSRLIKELQPKVFVMENVSGMIKGKMKGKFLEILQELKDCGYNVKCKLMNAMWYDVPQSRERVIFIGVRNDLKVDPGYPKPQDKITILKDALKGIKNTKEEIQEASYKENVKCFSLLKQMKAGECGGKYANGSFFNLVRLDWNKVPGTILKGHGQSSIACGHCHPTENRKLTIHELKRVQSFNDGFKFIGTFQEQWARIGNSVPPNLMKAIALNIKTEILLPIFAK